MKNYSKFAGTAVKIIAAAVIITLAVLTLLNMDKLSVSEILRFTPANPALAALVLLLMYALKSLSIFFPINILFAAGGLLFPLPAALAINTLGMAITISIPFFIGHKLGVDAAARYISRNKKIAALYDLQIKNDLFFCLIVRAVSCLPCDPLSLYLGALGIPYRRYILGGVLGFLPSLIALTVMGTSLSDIHSPQFIVSMCALVIMITASFIVYGIYKKRSKNNQQ